MLLDTSGLLNLLSPREAHHADAVNYYHQKSPSVTHNLVLAELVALANARGVPRSKVW
jgi:predicted nucleic acid-binding protein